MRLAPRARTISRVARSTTTVFPEFPNHGGKRVARWLSGAAGCAVLGTFAARLPRTAQPVR
jgi:hypothetical protein